VGAPSLADVIRAGIHSAAADLHVSIPATVVRVELGRGLVDAQPLVKDIFEGQAASVPVITNVPIVWPGAGGFRLTFPIAVDDVVLLVFSDRSLDLWLEKGGEVDPKDPRRHALSDAIAIPGLRSFNAPWSGASADGVTLGKDGGTQVKVKDGAIELGGNAKAVARVDDAVAAASNMATWIAAVNTALLGPGVGQPLVGVAVVAPTDFGKISSGSSVTKSG
jgi:hypothetical protein